MIFDRLVEARRTGSGVEGEVKDIFLFLHAGDLLYINFNIFKFIQLK